ncbi:MAG: protein-L-isoaspartate(D-aspartate) O-methyltransferase [Holophagaceae bacterium]|nr:protein-L-isoaspartate(D-aspartate) O-methyltransferase [Holophagaceae bacterium]
MEDLADRRARMVREQIAARGVVDPNVLAAMAAVPREAFVPEGYVDAACEDRPLPLGLGQTLSQPYIVAFMAEALELAQGDKVLDVGAGSGYAAAVLARLAGEVHAVELLPALAAQAEATLRNLDIGNIQVHCADGALGWPEGAPYDAIHVACAALEIPSALFEQLKEGGRLVLPVGEAFGSQWLVRVRKREGRLWREELLAVAFVPMR